MIFGCVDTVGGQAGDIARTCWLAAGLPEHVPGTTVDRQCGSAQQAVHFAAQAVMAGVNDVVVAGGVQQMSMIPISSAMTLAADARLRRTRSPAREGWVKRYGRRRGQPVPRRRDDRREVGHHPRRHGGVRGRVATSGPSGPAPRAASRREIAPLDGLDHDEGPREPNWEKIRSLQPLARAAGSPRRSRRQISDASAAMLIVSEAGAEGPRPHAAGPHPPHERAGRRPDLHAHRADPGHPVRASRRPGMTMDDIDLVEINEAFASVVLAWEKELDVDLAKVNVNGGAIALGHPLGATGARLMTTLLNELERTGGRYGLQTMCEGGGQANVTIIERLS